MSKCQEGIIVCAAKSYNPQLLVLDYQVKHATDRSKDCCILEKKVGQFREEVKAIGSGRYGWKSWGQGRSNERTHIIVSSVQKATLSKAFSVNRAIQTLFHPKALYQYLLASNKLF
uniref:Uncharacterized protein n=1 Tax=Pyxicephalus adspersus TaxID=30357 RepID=A0AAV2ZF42_PYXAD|nr:TPA: hypothetical protein GDO54_004202 [Pyxicephalus adspersus]